MCVARVITMATGNIVCIISAACLTYLPSDQKWNRLVAYWFTSFQVSPASKKLLPSADCRVVGRVLPFPSDDFEQCKSKLGL